VRRITGERQVGHAGTLDPAASGVLPVAVGHATKLLPYIEDAGKTYVATVRFGVVTDSADRDGRLVDRRNASHLTADTITSALAGFRGEIRQVPPMQSAIKIGGRKLYELARQGEIVDVPERAVTIHRLSLERWEPPDATLVVDCSKGTYIRSLARDIGETVGTGAMLANLVRTRAGDFSLETTIPIEQLGARLAEHGWSWIALHPDHVLRDARILILAGDDEARWRNGLPVRGQADGPVVRVYDSRRDWIGIGTTDGSDMIQPKRVIHEDGGKA
jgi:tRNA pseudouridine55 synthase